MYEDILLDKTKIKKTNPMSSVTDLLKYKKAGDKQRVSR